MNGKQFSRLPEPSQDIRNRVSRAIAEMRGHGHSLHEAAREHGVSPDTMVRLSGTALRKLSNGRYVARASDSLFRTIVLPTRRGLREAVLSDSRSASIVGKYWNAVHAYLATGDDSALHDFRPRYVADADSNRVELLTNLDELDRLASAGVLSFESIYARSL